MRITCGIDWAEAHHDVALVDEESRPPRHASRLGTVVARARVGTDVAGFAAIVELIAEHDGSPTGTPVAIETDKNLLVVALAGAGFTVYPINPRAVARYRERHGQAGGKSDPGDAAVLANVLRTDRHMHRSLPLISEQALAIKALARQHQEAIWAMNQTISRLRSVLLEFYPQAIKAFPHLKHHAATTVLAGTRHHASRGTAADPARTACPGEVECDTDPISEKRPVHDGNVRRAALPVRPTVKVGTSTLHPERPGAPPWGQPGNRQMADTGQPSRLRGRVPRGSACAKKSRLDLVAVLARPVVDFVESEA